MSDIWGLNILFSCTMCIDISIVPEILEWTEMFRRMYLRDMGGSNRLSDDKSTMIGKSLVQIQTQNYAPKRHANLVPVAPRSMCHRGGIVNLWQTWSAAPTHCWTVTWLGWGLRYLWRGTLRVHLTCLCCWASLHEKYQLLLFLFSVEQN